MKRICSCGNSTWRWDTANGKPMLFCTKCGERADNDLFSAEEVAQKFGVARSTIIKAILTQKIDSTSFEKQYRVSSEQLQEYIDKNTIRAKE